jgi:hypothetical protein
MQQKTTADQTGSIWSAKAGTCSFLLYNKGIDVLMAFIKYWQLQFNVRTVHCQMYHKQPTLCTELYHFSTQHTGSYMIWQQSAIIREFPGSV